MKPVTITITPLPDNGFDVDCYVESELFRDAHVRKDGDEWVMDAFDSTMNKSERNANVHFIDSIAVGKASEPNPNWNEILNWFSDEVKKIYGSKSDQNQIRPSR